MAKPSEVRWVTQPGEADKLQISIEQYTMRFQLVAQKVTMSAKEDHSKQRGSFIPQEIYRQSYAIAREEFAKLSPKQKYFDF